MATEINNVEAWPPDVEDEADEDATTEEVEDEGIEEPPDDEEPGCKSAGS